MLPGYLYTELSDDITHWIISMYLVFNCPIKPSTDRCASCDKAILCLSVNRTLRTVIRARSQHKGRKETAETDDPRMQCFSEPPLGYTKEWWASALLVARECRSLAEKWISTTFKYLGVNRTQLYFWLLRRWSNPLMQVAMAEWRLQMRIKIWLDWI